jgi:hypothetical protein
MSKFEHPIWRIGLFKRENKKNKEVECVECKKTLKISDGSVKSLIYHVQSEEHKDNY